MCCGKNVKHTASVLVELLASAFIVGIFIPVLLGLLKQTSDRVILMYDQRCAVQKILSAESLLKLPVFYCGYGMPSEAAEYQKSFQNIQAEPFSWEGPVSVISFNGRENAMLKTAYAKSCSVYTTTKISRSSQGTVQLNKNLPSDNLKASSAAIPQNIKNYLLFGGMTPSPQPLCVRNIYKNEVTLNTPNGKLFSIPEIETPYLFCALKVYAQNGKLYTKDYRTTGDQPRVDGIADIRFYLDDDNEEKKLTVYILASGNVKNSGRKIHLLDFAEDSTNSQLISEWKNLDAATSLYASKTVWSLPNCVRNGNFPQNTAE